MRAQIMILGTYHMHNPRADVLNLDVLDVLTDQRQAEIEGVVSQLEKFKPTKIAIEITPDDDTMNTLNTHYQQYLEGNYQLRGNEIEQIAFRLAAAMGHSKLYPTDYRNDFDFQAVEEYARANAQEKVMEESMAQARETMDKLNQLMKTATVAQILLHLNQPELLQQNHAPYMRLLGVGQGTEYIGTDLVVNWYERNLKIFTNVVRLIEPGDRIIVLFGGGHCPLLKQFVKDASDLELVEPSDYLSV